MLLSSSLITRRHRILAISLACIAAGIFFIFVTRVFLFPSDFVPRECGLSELYRGMKYPEARRQYHYLMQEIIDERMDLYEGKKTLRCSEEDLTKVIPMGKTSTLVAKKLPDFPLFGSVKYDQFEALLTELWRDYDCHLFHLENHPQISIGPERDRAQNTLSRVLYTLRASEEYLPVHAGLRCAVRGFTDVRNALALFSDASQCLQPSIINPVTSILK